jgi:hypothetical protein
VTRLTNIDAFIVCSQCKEFFAFFYLYQLLMYTIWFLDSFLTIAIVVFSVVVLAGVIKVHARPNLHPACHTESCVYLDCHFPCLWYRFHELYDDDGHSNSLICNVDLIRVWNFIFFGIYLLLNLPCSPFFATKL